jgi:transcriptional regulator with XRE-family HTH domain
MGNANRLRPDRLAAKLLAIRSTLKLSQLELAERLSTDLIQLRKSDISRYESGLRQPVLRILLRYARLAKISTDILIDDEMDLPMKFRSNS